VDEARHSGLWEITHQYELDHRGSSQFRYSGGRPNNETGSVSHAQTTVSPDTTHHGGVPACEHW